MSELVNEYTGLAAERFLDSIDAVASSPMATTDIEPRDPIQTTLWHAFLKMYHEDRANAAMHCATVRYSPLTFRLAEHLWAFDGAPQAEELRSVILDSGMYEEDPGR